MDRRTSVIGLVAGICVMLGAASAAAAAPSYVALAALASAAANHGFTFIDARAGFASHEICSSSPWLNNDTIPVQESYHPNIPGEAEYAGLVEAGL